MIFHGTWQMVLNGPKTQTRRLVKEGERFVPGGCSFDGMVVKSSKKSFAAILKWEVGRTYAIQPGRGEKAIGRFLLTRIRRESLRSISFDDACAEIGRSNRSFAWYGTEKGPQELFFELWDSIYPKGFRSKDKPDVWVLGLEVVQTQK